MRSVVFETQGKLDLRSLMTFGLNAKPNSGHPIGFFGTGLKYAIAVLARHKIPVTFYIDGKKWTINSQVSQFRDRQVEEVFIERHRSMLPVQSRKLPFTTELGKTWQLWQAFRELHSNTLDENGSTSVYDCFEPTIKMESVRLKKDLFADRTYIVVESEDFVQEYYDRHKTFLAEGLTLRDSTEEVQIFKAPSKHVYYRGIRILDLKEEDYSELTYNILRPIELTEDRTAKSQWDVQYHISRAIVAHSDSEIIEKAVTSKSQFDKGLNFTWGSPSTEFLDTVESLPSQAVPKDLATWTQSFRPKKEELAELPWKQGLIKAIKEDSYDSILKLIGNNKAKVIEALEAYEESDDIPF